MKKIDYKLFFLSIIAGLLGIIMIYSASNIWAEYKFNDPLKYVKHQALFFIIGILIMIILSKFDYKKYYKYANKILLVCFARESPIELPAWRANVSMFILIAMMQRATQCRFSRSFVKKNDESERRKKKKKIRQTDTHTLKLQR